MRFFPSEAWLLKPPKTDHFQRWSSSRNYFFSILSRSLRGLHKKWINPFKRNKTVKWVVLIWKSQLVSVADRASKVVQNQILIPRFVLLDHFSSVNIWKYVLSWPWLLKPIIQIRPPQTDFLLLSTVHLRPRLKSISWSVVQIGPRL